MNEAEEARPRNRVRDALKNYAKNHSGKLLNVRRATHWRVTEDMLHTMMADETAFDARTWLAVDSALKKLYLDDAQQTAAAIERGLGRL
jgi:hypothetical protein